MEKIFLLFALTVTFTFTACGGKKEGDNLAAGQTAIQAAMQVKTLVENSNAVTSELTVWGMSCMRCVNKITNAVSDLDGVISVSVDLRAQKAVVKHVPQLDVEEVKRTIRAEGYNIP